MADPAPTISKAESASSTPGSASSGRSLPTLPSHCPQPRQEGNLTGEFPTILGGPSSFSPSPPAPSPTSPNTRRRRPRHLRPRGVDDQIVRPPCPTFL